MRPGAVALVTALLLGIAACGGDDDDDEPAGGSAPPAQEAIAPGPKIEDGADPASIDCSQLANRENHAAAYSAAIELAQDVKLADASAQQTAERILAGMNDLCKKRGDGAYKPAEDAVAAVKRGEYKVESGLQ